MTDVDLESALARIRRARAESDKFIADQHKLRAEAEKYECTHTALAMAAGAALLGTGVLLGVLGGLLLRLLGGR